MATLPTLTLSGWISDKNILINKLFFYFVTTDYSQSVLYHGNLSSLRYLLREYGDDFDGLTGAVSSTLTKLYMRYFNNVDVTSKVSTQKYDNNTKEDNYLIIEITATDTDGKQYTLEQSVNITNFDTIKLDDFLSKLYS